MSGIVASSLLPNLEPILGATLALNLAYVALPRFRYRSQMRETARGMLAELEDLEADQKRAPWYRTLSYLAALENDGSQKSLDRKSSPSGVWFTAYKIVYSRHADRWATIAFAVLCYVFLTLGVAHGLWPKSYWADFFTGLVITLIFYFTVLMAVIPVFLAWWGGRIVMSAIDYCEREFDSIKAIMRDSAKRATLPEILDFAD